MMTLARVFCLGCLLAVVPASAQMAHEVCKTYVVAQGDTLRQVARIFYNGNSSLFSVIYEANRDVIGPSPHQIRVGTRLSIPCMSGMTLSQGTAVAVAPPKPAPKPAMVEVRVPVVVESVELTAFGQSAEVNAALSGTLDLKHADATADDIWTPYKGHPIRMLTANGYPPYTGESLPGGGLFTQLVETAVFRADPDQPYSVTFIDDWQAHLDALLPEGAYDISFPWARPDCDAPDGLPAADRDLCTNFAFSAPYEEITESFFAAADSDLVRATDYQAFRGRRICRPEALSTSLLDTNGLTADTVTMTRPAEALDCFKALAAGQVDLVVVDATLGQAILQQLGLATQFRQNPQLTQTLTLHIIAHKSNPGAVEMLKLLDEGAQEMTRTGEWQDILARGLGG